MKLPFLPIALKNAFSKPSTVNFPAEMHDAKPNYKGRIAYDPEKCVNCGMCIKVCAPEAITRTFEETPEGTKITYAFDMCSCTFCGTCQDFCEEKAITLTGDYHLTATDPKDLVTVGSRIKQIPKGDLICGDACVFCGLCAKVCPEGAITVDRATKTWTCDHSKCVKCGKCIAKCPKKTLSFAEPAPEGVLFDEEKCVYCTLCAKKCPNGAITVDRPNKTWAIDRDACTVCGLCVKGCPKKALEIGPLPAEGAAKPAPAAEAAPAEAPKEE